MNLIKKKNSNWLKYPSEYHVDFQVKKKSKTEILDQLPKNKISTAKVDSTFSYSSGGKFDSTKGIGRTSSNSYPKRLVIISKIMTQLPAVKIITGMYTGQLLRNDLKYGGEVKK